MRHDIMKRYLPEPKAPGAGLKPGLLGAEGGDAGDAGVVVNLFVNQAAEGEVPEATDIPLEDAANEMTDVEEEGTELDEGAAAVENLQIAVESFQAKGGFGAETAQFVQMSYVQSVSRLGPTLAAQLSFPGVEAFGGETSRMEGLTAAVEEFKKTWSTIVQAIKEFLKNTADAIQSFVTGLFSKAASLRKQAAAIKAAAGKAGAARKINNAAGSVLSIDGTFSAESINTALTRTKELLTGTAVIGPEGADAATAALKDVIEHVKTNKDAFAQHAAAAAAGSSFGQGGPAMDKIKEIFMAKMAAPAAKLKQLMSTAGAHDLGGGVRLHIMGASSASDISEITAKNFSLPVMELKKAEGAKAAGGEIESLNKSQIEAVATLVEEIATLLEKEKDAAAKYKMVATTLSSGLDQLGEQLNVGTITRAIIRRIANRAMAPAQALLKSSGVHAARVCSAALSIAKQSIAGGVVEAAKPAEPAPAA